MREKLEKYDKLITAALVIIAFILAIGYWFAEEKSEPVYLSKIDKLMFDKDNKAPKFVLTLPDKLVAQAKEKNDLFVDIIPKQELHKHEPEKDDFSLEHLLAKMPNLNTLPNKQPTQSLKYVDINQDLSETFEKNKYLPKTAEDGRKAWSEYGTPVTIQPNFKKIAIVIAGLGLDPNAAGKIAQAFDSEVSLSFSPYTPQPYDAVSKARENGHETYADLLLSSKDFLKEDTGPLSITLNLSREEALGRFYQTIALPAPIGGIIIRDGVTNNTNMIILNSLLAEAKQRGLLVIDATAGEEIDKQKIAGLARRKADLVIHKDMREDEIRHLLERAENIAFDKGQVLIVSDPKPLAVMALYNWAQTFSPQISYEEAKMVDILKPFALVPVSNLVVE